MKLILIIVFNLLLMENALAQLESSIFAVVKVSYNLPGERHFRGGICGTAFLINDSTALTANHILNSMNYKPHDGFNFVQYWLLNRAENLIISLSKDLLESMEEIDATIIRLPESVECGLIASDRSTALKDSIRNFGHIGNKMPIIKMHWDNNLLVIDEYDLKNCASDSTGTVVGIKKVTINTNNIKLNDITVIQPSFKANVGASGGPLIKNNNIIGLMSFGLSPDSLTIDTVYAISIDEIFTRFKISTSTNNK